jgi:hypothetical protein
MSISSKKSKSKYNNDVDVDEQLWMSSERTPSSVVTPTVGGVRAAAAAAAAMITTSSAPLITGVSFISPILIHYFNVSYGSY